jgi:hypothetical protein
MRWANSTSSSVAGRSTTSSRIRPSLRPVDFLGRDHHRDLVAAGPQVAGADPADEGLVDLDHAAQPVAVGADHGAAQFVHPGPGSLVGAEPEHPQQPLRGDAFFCEVTNQIAANHDYSGVRVRWKIVPAVSEVFRPQS